MMVGDSDGTIPLSTRVGHEPQMSSLCGDV